MVDSSSSPVECYRKKGKREDEKRASTNATKIKGWIWDLLFQAKLSTSTLTIFLLPTATPKRPGFLRLSLAPMLIRLVYYDLRAMEVRSIPAFAGGRAPAPFLCVSLVCLGFVSCSLKTE